MRKVYSDKMKETETGSFTLCCSTMNGQWEEKRTTEMQMCWTMQITRSLVFSEVQSYITAFSVKTTLTAATCKRVLQ